MYHFRIFVSFISVLLSFEAFKSIFCLTALLFDLFSGFPTLITPSTSSTIKLFTLSCISSILLVSLPLNHICWLLIARFNFDRVVTSNVLKRWRKKPPPQNNIQERKFQFVIHCTRAREQKMELKTKSCSMYLYMTLRKNISIFVAFIHEIEGGTKQCNFF